MTRAKRISKWEKKHLRYNRNGKGYIDLSMGYKHLGHMVNGKVYIDLSMGYKHLGYIGDSQSKTDM